MRCPKLFDTFEDLLHHLELDHMGIEPEILTEATNARETKKQLGDYLNVTEKGVGVECPTCFDMFKGIDVLIEHARKVHNKDLDPKFKKLLDEMIKNNPDEPPLCKKCNKRYLGLITTKINNTVQNVCFNCYERYFGTNALTRITIGTPNEMIIKMRIPLS